MFIESNDTSIMQYDGLCFCKFIVLRVLTQSLAFLTFLLWFGGQRKGGGGGLGGREGFLKKPGCEKNMTSVLDVLPTYISRPKLANCGRTTVDPNSSPIWDGNVKAPLLMYNMQKILKRIAL